MKKILVVSVLLSAFSTSAFAEVGIFYFKIDAGTSLLNDLNSDGNYFAQKFDNRNTPFINLGVGWTVMDNLRADFNFSYQLHNTFTANALTSAQYSEAPALTILNDTTNYSALAAPTGVVIAGSPMLINMTEVAITIPADVTGFIVGTATRATETAGLNSKVNLATVTGASVQDTLKIFSVMPRVYFDLFDYGGGKFFVGGALGYANVQYQSNLTVSYTAAAEAEMAATVSHHNYINQAALTSNPEDQTATLSSPTSANFAFGLHAGMDYKIPSWEGVKLNLEYSYTSYGQVKKLTVGTADVVLMHPLTISMNNLSLGLRIEM
jgi:opacity protein-like surface antigen